MNQKIINIFISLPMGGKSEAEICYTLNNAIEELEKIFPNNNIQIVSQILNFPNQNSLYYLGESIKLLSKADVAYFLKDWQNYRGCQIEYLCCQQYNIPIIYQSEI